MLKPKSLFSQLLSEIFTAVNFNKLVTKWVAERKTKEFKLKTQLISVLFCYLAGKDYFQEIVNGISCFIGKLFHRGISFN